MDTRTAGAIAKRLSIVFKSELKYYERIKHPCMVVANISQEEKEYEIIRKYNCMIFCITWNEKSLFPTQYLCFIKLGFS